eukprot:TRINITY_DN22446_c0_g1_i1.p1 TRINITY_DN22446_c0_g1~~TRINITY_DN22446_c0_g1_i1.p1  ORF type:complete len:264 (+),score=47.08 TRINITY_DN22446_c0_g1_i1:237-1028(+)
MSEPLPPLVKPAEWDPARFEDLEKLQLRQTHSERQEAQTAQLSLARQRARSMITFTRRVEHAQEVQHRRLKIDERVKRWTSKTEGSPLSVDLWAEDDKLWQKNLARSEAQRLARKKEAAQKHEANNLIIQVGLAERDDLNELRMEKKRLVDQQKKLKASLDIEKVNKRIESITRMRMRNQKELESRPQLQHWASDFCTMPIRKGDGFGKVHPYLPRNARKGKKSTSAPSSTQVDGVASSEARPTQSSSQPPVPSGEPVEPGGA